MNTDGGYEGYWVGIVDGCLVTSIKLSSVITEVINDHNHCEDMTIVAKICFKNILLAFIREDPFLGSQTVYDKTVVEYLDLYGPINNVSPLILKYTSLSSLIFRKKRTFYPSTLLDFYKL
ncbi:hypothetical protein NGRA_2245 [Nosema granulosis]|uniref:Uncharacterized protein n=1 Tax=Nosema granulosis TaxID=83296 RepID=A0A9P6GYI1_9MICR|nr:hypothetical protein NGRA_2245 [Nosema granulosis]